MIYIAVTAYFALVAFHIWVGVGFGRYLWQKDHPQEPNPTR